MSNLPIIQIDQRADILAYELSFLGKKIKVYPEQEELLRALSNALQCCIDLGQPQMIDLCERDRKALLVLCHPDKHNNSKKSTEMFQKLNGSFYKSKAGKKEI